MTLTPLEIACGWVFDVDSQPSPLPEAGPSPFQALQQAVLPALRRPPCVVSFSGGVDSSLVLAAAAEAARSEGLPSPVPVTLRFPASQAAQEDEWQEGVIRHLGLSDSDWVRLTFDDELDLVGPIASRVLRQHGVVWPPNSHFHVPVFDQARGGSALTGYGGDHLLSAWPWRHPADVLAGRVQPVPRDLLALGLAPLPAFLRRHRERRRVTHRPWLTQDGAEQARELEVRIAAHRPRPWAHWLRWQIGTRRIRVAQASLSLLGMDRDVRVHSPLLDPQFVAALARQGPRLGLGDRRRIIAGIACHRLPPSLVARPTKATFDAVFWSDASRAFAAECDGRGIDHSLVRFEKLREIWGSPTPTLLTGPLLQSEWLRAMSSRAASPPPA